MMQHGRAPWPTPDELTSEERVLYDEIVGGPRQSEPSFELVDDQGRLEGPFNTMLLNPVVGSALQNVGAAVRYGTSFTEREREIAILTVAADRRSDFEWYAHEQVGRRVGLVDQELASLLRHETADSFTQGERLIQATVRALLRDRDLDDDQFAAVCAELGPRKVGELVSLVGYYDYLALSLRIWRTPLPSGVTPAFASTTGTPD